MTVANNNTRWAYDADPAATNFIYDNKIFDATDLTVFIDEVPTLAFSVTNVGEPNGGNVVMDTPLAGGEKVLIVRDVPPTQDLDYVENDPFPAESHEDGLDRLTIVVQQILEANLRSLRLPVAEATTLLNDLPSLSERLGKVMGFDLTTGQPIAVVGTIDAANVSAFGQTLIDDADAATALATLGAQADLDVLSQAEAEAGIATAERIFTAQRVQQAIGALTPLPRGHISGMQLTNNGDDGAHDIDISVGAARDTADAANLKLTAALTKRIDATWVAGDDAGGLSSTLTPPANNTWYHVHAIIVAGVVDVGFDTSISAANLITDHSATAYRRLGSVLTDGSANIIAFLQTGDVFQWKTPIVDVDVLSPGTLAVIRTLSVPPGLKVEAFGVALMESENGVGNGSTILTDPDVADTVPALGNTIGTTNLNTANTGSQFRVVTNTSREIRSRSSETGTNVGLELDTFGWREDRGREL